MARYGSLNHPKVCTRAFSSGIAWPESEANNSSPSSIKSMSMGLYLSSLACVYLCDDCAEGQCDLYLAKHGKLHSSLEK